MEQPNKEKCGGTANFVRNPASEKEKMCQEKKMSAWRKRGYFLVRN